VVIDFDHGERWRSNKSSLCGGLQKLRR
jgi:hypothetical protein